MTADGIRADARVLVLVPDLSLDGGVTNYYRVLGLDEIDTIDYFSVNRPGTRTILVKIVSLITILPRYLSRVAHYDIVHINPSLNPKSYWRDALLLQFALLLKKRTIVFFRGWDDAHERRIANSKMGSWIFRQTYGRADRILVLGEVFAEKVRALLGPRRVPIQIETTVADDSGLSTSTATSAISVDASPTTLLFLARLVKGKGLLTTINAMKILRETTPEIPWQLRVAGKGSLLEEAQQLVRDLGLDDLVSFEGHVDDAARGELLRSSHMFVYPTRHGEGMPNGILEAMLFGLPVITSPAGAISEIVAHGENGALLPDPTPERVAEAVAELAQSPGVYTDISQRNREVAQQRFTPKRVRERLLTIYRETAVA